MPVGNPSHKFGLKINKILTALTAPQLFLPLECQLCSGTKWKFAAKYLNRQQSHMALATAPCSPNGAVSAMKQSQVLCTATGISPRQSFCQKQTAAIFIIIFFLLVFLPFYPFLCFFFAVPVINVFIRYQKYRCSRAAQ